MRPYSANVRLMLKQAASDANDTSRLARGSAHFPHALYLPYSYSYSICCSSSETTLSTFQVNSENQVAHLLKPSFTAAGPGAY